MNFKLKLYLPKSTHGISRILVFIIVLIYFSGCSTVSTVKDATVKAAKTTVNYTTKVIPYMGGPDQGIVRKVAVIPFENETIFKQLALETTFQNTMLQYISRSCQDIYLLFSDAPGFPEPFKAIKRRPAGDYDNLMLVQTGRQSGLNAILTGRIINLSLAKKDEGILWFRETKESLKIQLHVEVIEMETGSKVFDDRLIYEINDVAPEDIQAYKDGQPTLFPSIIKDMDKLAEDMAEKICTGILSQPWTVYVASVSDNRAFLPFGKKSGIKKGDILDAYNTGEVVENFAGQHFFLPGKKIGKIKISQVDEDFSTGDIVSGENIMAGSPVKISK